MLQTGYEKIRANQLQVGDIYIKQNIEFVVNSIKNGKINYRYYASSGPSAFIGAKSQEWVIRIGKVVKPDTRPIKVIAHKNGHIYGKYRTFHAAGKDTGICKDSIAKYLNGWRPKKPYPFHFTHA